MAQVKDEFSRNKNQIREGRRVEGELAFLI